MKRNFCVPLHTEVVESRELTTKEKIGKRVGQLFCYFRSLGQHNLLLNHQPHKVSLVCSDCGWESQGWSLERKIK